MNIFIDKEQLTPYFLEQDTNKEIEFQFGPIDVISMFSIRNNSKDNSYLDLMVGFLRHSLKSAKGMDIPLEEVEIPMLGKKKVVSMDFINTLKVDVFTELATQAYKLNNLSEQDQKN